MPSLRDLGRVLQGSQQQAVLSLNDLQKMPEIEQVRFIGEKARTSDKDALATAKMMQAAGRPRDEIWNATGWGIGPSGHWISEIDDANFKLAPGARDLFAHSASMAYGKVFNDPDALAAYPELAETVVEGGFKGDLGQQDQDHRLSFSSSIPLEKLRSVTLHEIQHELDNLEGHDDGLAGSPRHPMEVLARAVETRQSMSPQERRATPPWSSYDVPESEIQYYYDGAPALDGGLLEARVQDYLANNKLDPTDDAIRHAIAAVVDIDLTYDEMDEAVLGDKPLANIVRDAKQRRRSTSGK